jgi:hypothetical protein
MIRRAIAYTAALRSGAGLSRRLFNCSLCDTETDDWLKHSSQPQHQARQAVCAALVSPERHEVVMKQLWEHIQLDFSQIDDVNEARISKRRSRLRSTTMYLKQVEILSSSLVYAEEHGVCVKARFMQFAVTGEAQLSMEVADRVARLLPKASGCDLLNIVSFILCQRHLVQMFDAIGMEVLLPQSLKLTKEQKAAVFLSIYGELTEYTRRRHSHDVANKAAADRLVGNVLASHAIENIASELVHTVLQKIVDEGTPVWAQFKAEGSERLKQGSIFATTPLLQTPSASPNAPVEASRCRWLHELSPNAKASPHQALRTKTIWSDLMRVSTLEITVPNPVTKTSFFATMMPKLALKQKNSPK